MPARHTLLALALASPLHLAFAQSPRDCLIEPDSQRRLQCYDTLHGRPTEGVATPAAAPASAVKQGVGSTRAEAAAARSREQPTLLARAWELDPGVSHLPFELSTYQPNFILPLHVSRRYNRTPSSPSQGTAATAPDFNATKVKMQLSLRAKLLNDLPLVGGDLWFAYTQRSLWQLYDTDLSAPFRTSDHEPQLLYVLPTPKRWAEAELGGWRWTMTQLALAHQSNGSVDPVSRSWNRVSAAVTTERGDVSFTLRGHRRLNDGKDDNPDLTRFIGNTELVAAWLPGPTTATLTWRTHPKAWRRGSLQADWTYPVFGNRVDGLRWYVQLFHGYGESLLDYNFRQTSLGVGVTLFRP